MKIKKNIIILGVFCLFLQFFCLFLQNCPVQHVAGFPIPHHICACLLRYSFAKHGISMISSEIIGVQIQKLGVLWENYCKQCPIRAKLGVFSIKNGILMGPG